jgi:CubicO group peptidase (beta-lactamase class C family)
MDALRKPSCWTRTAALTVATLVAAIAGNASAAATADRPVATPSPVARTRAPQQTLGQLIADGAPGALLCTNDEGRVTALHCGLADTARTPMDPRYRYRIGSLTRPTFGRRCGSW